MIAGDTRPDIAEALHVNKATATACNAVVKAKVGVEAPTLPLNPKHKTVDPNHINNVNNLRVRPLDLHHKRGLEPKRALTALRAGASVEMGVVLEEINLVAFDGNHMDRPLRPRRRAHVFFRSELPQSCRHM